MKKYKFLSIAMILTFMIINGCDDDILNKVDPNNSTPETFFTDLSALNQAIIASYATQAVEAAFNRRGYWLGEFPADDIESRGEDPYDQFTYGSNDASIFRVWRAFYMIINRANQAIFYAQELEASDETEVAGKARIIAEGRFLRSLYHYYLTMWWGDVPYRDETTLTNPFLPVTERAEILSAIVDDLNEAIPGLPSKAQQPEEERGRATKGAARTLLARVLMVQQNWPEAEAVCSQIISDDYSLLPDLRDIHDPANPFNDESIYEIVFKNTGGGDHDWSLMTTRGNNPTRKSSFRSYWVYRYNRNGGAGRASQKLIDAYDDPADPRLSAYYYGPGSTVDGGPYDFDTYGYSIRKFITDVDQQDRANEDNFIMFRLADVVLMRAEARAMQNKLTEALEDLNLIRLRAREGATGIVEDRSSGDQAEVMEFIKNERFIELSAEVVRFIDIKRWEAWDELGSGFVPDRDEVFPLPDSEVTNNTEINSNNPGW